jgi:hypothetical protein
MMKPDEIRVWSAEFRAGSEGKFQINLWIPEAPPIRDFESEKRQREFLAMWGPPVPTDAGDATLPNFEAQCQAMIAAAPTVISSIMGLYPPDFVSEMKAHRILWFDDGRGSHGCRSGGCRRHYCPRHGSGWTPRSLPRRGGGTSNGGPDGPVAAGR